MSWFPFGLLILAAQGVKRSKRGFSWLGLPSLLEASCSDSSSSAE